MSRHRLSLEQQIEAARAELEEAVNQGQDSSIELVLSRYPELVQSQDAVLELIYLEFVLHQEAGQQSSPEQYVQRFPRLAQRITKLFEFEKLLESGWTSPETLDALDGNLVTPSIAPALDTIPAEGNDARATLARIGDYDCVSVIGRGGMGVVYRAIHRTLGRTAAIKVVSLLVSGDDKSTERFLNEARFCSSLNHPHIVQIYDSGVQDGIPFFVMEYMPGGSLQEVLLTGPLEPKIAAQVVRTLAQAVAFAHSQSIVHRDLKPGNVLITSAGGEEGIQLRPDRPRVVLKISDFGLAKCLTEPWSQTRTGTPVGTPAYMAPEQIGTARAVDARSDVYALGALLYHLLVGKPPFLAASVIETLQLVQSELPMSIRTLQPSVSRDLETICLKCLQKEPEQRYQSVQELNEDLQRYAERRPILARPVSLVERLWRWAKRKPLAAVFMTSVLIAIVLTTTLWLRAESYRRAADRANSASQVARQQALVALRKLTSTVVLKKFAQQDQLTAQDRVYLQEIAALYEQLAQLPQSGMASSQIRGEGHYWSGIVYLRLADSPTAIEHFKSAIEVLDSMEESEKSEVVFEMIIDSMESMVQALENDNQIQEAITWTKKRLDRCQNPPQYLSDTARNDCQRSIIAGYRQLGHLNDLLGDSRAAMANWQEAQTLIEAALLATPEDLKLLSALAGTLRSMASLEPDLQSRLSLGSQAIELARHLTATYPDLPDCARQLAWTLFDQAVSLKAAEQLEQSLELTEEAIEIAQALVDYQPLMDEYRGPLAVYLGLQGQLLNKLGRFAEAQNALMRSIELLRRNLETSPNALVVHGQHTRSWIQLLQAQLGNQANHEVVQQTRQAAEAALEKLREVMQTSGASLDKYHELKRALEAL